MSLEAHPERSLKSKSEEQLRQGESEEEDHQVTDRVEREMTEQRIQRSEHHLRKELRQGKGSILL